LFGWHLTWGQFDFSHLIKGRPHYYHVLSPLDFFTFSFFRVSHPQHANTTTTNNQLSFKQINFKSTSTMNVLILGRWDMGVSPFTFFLKVFILIQISLFLMILILWVFNF